MEEGESDLQSCQITLSKMSGILFLFITSVCGVLYLVRQCYRTFFGSLDMISYRSLNILKIADLKSCLINSTSRLAQGCIFDCFLFFVRAIFFLLFLYVFLISKFSAIQFPLRCLVPSVLKYLKFSI